MAWISEGAQPTSGLVVRRRPASMSVSPTSEGAPRLLLTPAEAAAALAISRSKLYRLMRAGLVPSVLLGGNRRISVDSLERLVEELAVTRPGQDDPAGP